MCPVSPQLSRGCKMKEHLLGPKEGPGWQQSGACVQAICITLQPGARSPCSGEGFLFLAQRQPGEAAGAEPRRGDRNRLPSAIPVFISVLPAPPREAHPSAQGGRGFPSPLVGHGQKKHSLSCCQNNCFPLGSNWRALSSAVCSSRPPSMGPDVQQRERRACRSRSTSPEPARHVCHPPGTRAARAIAAVPKDPFEGFPPAPWETVCQSDMGKIRCFARVSPHCSLHLHSPLHRCNLEASIYYPRTDSAYLRIYTAPARGVGMQGLPGARACQGSRVLAVQQGFKLPAEIGPCCAWCCVDARPQKAPSPELTWGQTGALLCFGPKPQGQEGASRILVAQHGEAGALRGGGFGI